MKYSLLALFIFLTSPLFGQGLTPSQLPAYLKGVPHMPYHSVPNVLKFPKDVYLGEGAGVALNKQGDIFVSSRTGPGGHMLMEFDPNGNYVRSIGDSCYCFLFPHMVQVDSEGNVWTVDDGSNMVVKWHYDGTDWRPVLYLGRRSEPFGSGDTDDGFVLPRAASLKFSNLLFNMPTDVAFGLQGQIYVADGYMNDRVQEFDKYGKFIKGWGGKGTSPGQFNVPHGIIVDNKGLVYVADRENKRVQIFTPDGQYLRQWDNVGHPWSMCLTSGPNQTMYIADGTADLIYKVDMNGHILGWYGGQGKRLGEFDNAHEIACGPDGTLYVMETRNYRLQKLVLNSH